MNKHATISFVVPAYNEEKHLTKTLIAITSEIERTGCKAEIIVVNNASTDGTRELAASFPEVVVVDEPVKGLVQARRAGFLRASGDLIANVDADTIVPEGWLNRVLAEFRHRPGLVALSGPYIYYDVPKRTRAAVQALQPKPWPSDRPAEARARRPAFRGCRRRFAGGGSGRPQMDRGRWPATALCRSPPR